MFIGIHKDESVQPYSDYEIAQRRIAERQKKRNYFYMALVFLAVPIFPVVFSPDISVKQCMIPLAVITGIFAISTGIELYYSSPEHAPSEMEIQQELEWLFGEHPHEDLSAQAVMFAHDRIRKRRIGRWTFWAHAILFAPTSTLFVLDAIQWHNFNSLFAMAAWLFVFLLHRQSAFPSKECLEKRERKFGHTLQFELSALRPEKPKVREKLKRGKYYIVGDDGELEEVEDEITQLEDKPKRMTRDGE